MRISEQSAQPRAIMIKCLLAINEHAGSRAGYANQIRLTSAGIGINGDQNTGLGVGVSCGNNLDIVGAGSNH